MDDSQIYDYDHQDEDPSHHGHGRPQSRASHNSENGYGDQNQQYARHGKDYYPYGRSEPQNQDDEDDDMW